MKKPEGIPEELTNDPYKYICDFAELAHPHVGGYVFETLSLVPVSLIIDDLDYFSKKIRTNLSVFFLAESGGCKSSICNQFEKFAYFPIPGRSYTPAELENEILRNPIFSLIIEDYTTMSADERTNKIVEGLIGDEKMLDRHTTQKDIRKTINGCSLLCGVPQDISHRLTTGTLSRVLCVVKIYNDEEHSHIGRHIITNVGKKSDVNKMEESIITYYKLLQMIQADRIKEYEPVKEFEIPENIRTRIFTEWDNLTKKIRKKAPFNFFREEYDGVRVLVAYAFLNYFNRKIENGKLFVTEKDCDVAIKIMKRNLITKYNLLMSDKLGKSIKNVVQFKKIMDSENIPEEIKQLVPFYVKEKLGRDV